MTGVAARKGDLTWGYGGSGVSALAFSLLAAEVGEAVAELLYKPFRDDVVAGWNADLPWRLHSHEIRRWAVSHITTRRLLAGMRGEQAPLLTARVYPWVDGSSIDAGWPDALAVLNTGVLAFNGEAVSAWRREGELARLETAESVLWCEADPIERLRELVPPQVAGMELRLLRYPALFGGVLLPATYEGRCLVRWRSWHSSDGPQAVVVVSALDGELAQQLDFRNDSTTITNRVTWLASVLCHELCSALDVPPERCTYIEHLPARGRKIGQRWESPADFSLVTADWSETPLPPDDAPAGLAWYAHNARWVSLSRAAAEARMGMALDDDALRAAWHAWPATIAGARRYAANG